MKRCYFKSYYRQFVGRRGGSARNVLSDVKKKGTFRFVLRVWMKRRDEKGNLLSVGSSWSHVPRTEGESILLGKLKGLRKRCASDKDYTTVGRPLTGERVMETQCYLYL